VVCCGCISSHGLQQQGRLQHAPKRLNCTVALVAMDGSTMAATSCAAKILRGSCLKSVTEKNPLRQNLASRCRASSRLSRRSMSYLHCHRSGVERHSTCAISSQSYIQIHDDQLTPIIINTCFASQASLTLEYRDPG
jgi:hypothetical protein